MHTEPAEPIFDRGPDPDPFFDGGPPPPPPPRGTRADVAALFVLVDALRRAVPRDLDAQLTNLIREFLLTLRSTIDWYLDRLDRPQGQPEVENIPVD
ncbi:MAG TPA: hypothetical protein VEQ61_04990 [Thermoleophilaceae bacterium]|nr:hypothetical protein [Thermoleophilaceae bacterium]